MSEAFRFAAHNKKAKAKADKDKRAFLDEYTHNPDAGVKAALDKCGINKPRYDSWRRGSAEFRAEVSTIRANAGVEAVNQSGKAADEKYAIKRFEGDFVARRKHYFGFDTPWFQQETVNAYARAKAGDIVLVLMPPEHGKTSLTEDDLSDEIARNKDILITCVSEGQQLARKISSRIQRRMQYSGPFPDFVRDYGPFEPQQGEGGARQPWGVDAWSVYGSEAFDSRDYTFATGGWNSTIAGTRTDRLHIDDMQSLRSLNQTDAMIDRFRQDMLSRPGETGKTTMNGTRVGERDIYEWMDDEFRAESFYQKIEFPALVVDNTTGDVRPLWKEKYTLEQLERLRKKVGEEAWWRNYMQQPRTSSFQVFSPEGVAKSQNSMRSYSHRRDQMTGIENDECWISVDPSIGGINVVAAVHPGREFLTVLDIQEDIDLPRNSAIAEKIEEVARRLAAKGWRPTMLVIEAMAFQKGLVEDESIVAVAEAFGMRIESHLTGINKYDENVGVPSMASSVEAGCIDLAYNDNYDRAVSDGMTAQWLAWKPTRDRETGKLKFKRGNQLRQDQLMALWFLWIWWTDLRATGGFDRTASEAFTLQGLPYRPTSTGLLVPT